MDTEKKAIYWQGEIVGHIEIFGAEISTVYGTWHPANTSKTTDFWARLQEGENPTIFLESRDGLKECIVTSEPDDEFGQIDIRLI